MSGISAVVVRCPLVVHFRVLLNSNLNVSENECLRETEGKNGSDSDQDGDDDDDDDDESLSTNAPMSLSPAHNVVIM